MKEKCCPDQGKDFCLCELCKQNQQVLAEKLPALEEILEEVQEKCDLNPEFFKQKNGRKEQKK